MQPIRLLADLATILFCAFFLGTLGGCNKTPDAPAPASSGPPVEGEFRVPEQPFAELTGPYQVGVRDLFFHLDNRPEIFTADPEDRRRLLVRVWYPALHSGTDTPARYVPEPAEFDGSENFSGVLHVKTRGFQDASADPAGGPYPVLIFNPGGGWTRLSDTFWTEQLASHGYVVFAMDHQGFNQSVVFPDGYRFNADQHAFPEETGDLLTDARASWAHLDNHHFPEWLADNSFLLDHIEELAIELDGPFSGLLDTDKIGLFGWSFGGATAVQMSKDDSRVKAAIDGDGQLFGDVATTGTTRPVLLLHSQPDSTEPAQDASAEERNLAAVMNELMAEVRGNDQSLKDKSPEVWEVSIRGTNHGSFSDLVLAGPTPAGAPSPKRAHTIINELSLAFFDQTLKGTSSPLLENIEKQIPESYDVTTPQDR